MSFSDKVIALGGASGFGGAWLWSERIGGEIVAAVMVMAVIGLFSALAWRAELWEPRAAGETLLSLSPSRQSVMTVSLCLMLVSGMWAPVLGASPVGTAQAASYAACSDASAGGALLNLMGFSESEIEKYTDVDDACGREDLYNVTDSAVYSQMLTSKESRYQYSVTTQNTLQDSRSTAMAKAKIEIIESLNEEENETVARENAQERVDTYYSRMIYNLVQRWNLFVETSYDAADSSFSGSVYCVGTGDGDSDPVSAIHRQAGDPEGTGVQLPNGTTVDAYGLECGSGGWVTFGPEGQDHENKLMVSFNGSETKVWGDYSNNEPWYLQNVENDMQSQHDQIESNVDTVVTEVYQKYEAGELNSSDLAESSPTAVAQEASTDLNSTGNYAYANAALASVGLAGQTNASHEITLEDGTQIEGTLFLTGSNLALETGQTYNPEDINGSVIMTVSSLTANGTTRTGSDVQNYHPINQNFTIESATNTKTGEAVEVTQPQEKNYTTTNTSRIEQELKELRDAREFYRQQATLGSGGGAPGGGSSGISFDFGKEAMVYVAALAAAAFLVFGRN